MHIVQLGFTALIFKLNIMVAGYKLNFSEWVGLRLISQFANFISIFRGGVFTAFAYLKIKYSIKISILLAVFLINTIFTLLSLVPLFLVVLLFYQVSINFWFSTAIILPIKLVIFNLGINISEKIAESRLVNSREKLRKSIKLIYSNKYNWLLVVCINWLIFYLAAWSFQISFFAIDIDTKFETNFTFVLFSTLSNLVSLTPGNLGVQEVIIAYTSSKLDAVSFEDGIIASSIIRAINILLVMVGALLFSKILLGRWNVNLDQEKL